MRATNWLTRVYAAYSTPIKLAAGAAGVLAVGLIAYKVLKPQEAQKRDENELAEGVKKKLDRRGTYRVFENIKVISNSPEVAKETANAIASANLNPRGLEKLTIYVLPCREIFRVFTDDGPFGDNKVHQTDEKDTLVLFLPKEASGTFEQDENIRKRLEETKDTRLLALGKKDKLLFGTYKDYRKLLDNGIVPKVLQDHSLFNGLVEGVTRPEKYPTGLVYRVFENIKLVSNLPETAKAAANAIALKGLKPQDVDNLNIYVLVSCKFFRVFTFDGYFASREDKKFQSEKKDTIVLFLPNQESNSWEQVKDKWKGLERTEDEKLLGLGKERVLFGTYKDYRNLLDKGIVPKVLLEHSLFAEK